MFTCVKYHCSRETVLYHCAFTIFPRDLLSSCYVWSNTVEVVVTWVHKTKVTPQTGGDLLAKKKKMVDAAVLRGEKKGYFRSIGYLKEWTHAVFICKPLQLENKEYNAALPIVDIAGVS